MDTIFAVSSGRPPAGIAVLRISGPDAACAAIALAGSLPAPREARLRALRTPDGALLDRALMLWFPAPLTATGDDVVELHVHGGRAIIAAVEAALAAMPALRRAAPGEFTRRALMAGRIDLAQAEGLADLLAAETEAQRRAAIIAADGGLSRELRGWLDRLSMIGAMIEAELDFAEEDDVATIRDDRVADEIVALAAAMQAALCRPPVERLKDGVRVVIAGPPNAGKSALFNALVERDASIVSDVAGTTRDRVEAMVTRSGVALAISDTAGLAAHTADPIEAIGIDRARRAAAVADIVLWMGDDPPSVATRDRAIWLHSRADQAGRAALPLGPVLAVSIMQPETIAAVWALMTDRALALAPTVDDALLNARQRAGVETAARALAAAQAERDWLVLAEEIRIASRALGTLLAVEPTDAMLDALFGRFCIGK